MYEMWYHDIVFLLSVLHDEEVANPRKGGLGYFKFEFSALLDGAGEPHKIVHGFFLPVYGDVAWGEEGEFRG